jgi:predicted amidohydrolase
MSTVRVAVASTPLTATLEAAVPAAIAAVDAAGQLGAVIVCLPETGLPGHRDQAVVVPDYSAAEIEAALAEVGSAAGRAGIAAIVGAEWATERGREIVSVVFGCDGGRLGTQVKTQIDPSEERDYVPGYGRRTFDLGELRFGIAICHEGFRYPEVVRAMVLEGARVVFAPHYVVTDDGSLPGEWCAASNPYN